MNRLNSSGKLISVFVAVTAWIPDSSSLAILEVTWSE